jgi:hypothetical protein
MESVSDQKEFKIGDVVRHNIHGIVRIVGIPMEGILSIVSPYVNKTKHGSLQFEVSEIRVKHLTSLEKELL